MNEFAALTFYDRLEGCHQTTEQLNDMYVPQRETNGIAYGGSTATAPTTANVTLQAPLCALLDVLRPESLRGVVRRILVDFCRLLKYQQQVEMNVYQGRSLKQTLFMLRLVHDETRALLQYIDARPSTGQGAEVWGLVSRVGRG